MKLVLLALALLVTKKLAEFALSVFCVLLFGYGSYVLIRDATTPGVTEDDEDGRRNTSWRR